MFVMEENLWNIMGEASGELNNGWRKFIFFSFLNLSYKIKNYKNPQKIQTPRSKLSIKKNFYEIL